VLVIVIFAVGFGLGLRRILPDPPLMTGAKSDYAQNPPSLDWPGPKSVIWLRQLPTRGSDGFLATGSSGKPESNWIETIPGKGWFTYFRLYGPTQP